jgi:hypothetical protein
MRVSLPLLDFCCTLSPAMVRVLGHLAAGRSVDHHCRTQSDHGGLAATIFALRKRKLLDWEAGELTELGRKVADLVITQRGS